MELAEKNTKTVNINKLHMVEKVKENMTLMRREMEEIIYIIVLLEMLNTIPEEKKKDMEWDQQKIRHWKTKYQ